MDRSGCGRSYTQRHPDPRPGHTKLRVAPSPLFSVPSPQNDGTSLPAVTASTGGVSSLQGLSSVTSALPWGAQPARTHGPLCTRHPKLSLHVQPGDGDRGSQGVCVLDSEHRACGEKRLTVVGHLPHSGPTEPSPLGYTAFSPGRQCHHWGGAS